MVHLLLKVCLLLLPSVAQVLAVSKSANPCTTEGLVVRCKNLQKLPSGLPPNMTGLLIHSASLYKLNYNFFGSDALSNLEHLEIVGGNITVVSPETFRKFSNLEILHLGSMKIRSLPVGVFKGLDRVQRIVVTSNFIESIPPGVFQDAAAELQALVLNHNKIEDIRPGTLAQLPNLHLLNLDANRLSKLRQDMFYGLPELRDLYLEYNEIRNLPQGVFESLRNLRTLALGNNLLESLSPASFRGLKRLQVLILNKNKLPNLRPGIFKLLKDLEELHINDNLLTVLKAGTFEGLSKLGLLTLNRNKISRIEADAFKHLNSLYSLRLHRNRLTTVGGFTQLPSLVVLELKNNNITQIPAGALGSLPRLENLSLKNNFQLRTISLNAFSSNGHLDTLFLTGCRSLIIPTDRPLLKSASLTYVNLDNAGISELPDIIFQGLPKLERISLNGNKLKTLVRGPFRSLPKGGIVEVSRNPLRCDCALHEVSQWCKQAGIKISGTCSGNRMKNVFLKDLRMTTC